MFRLGYSMKTREGLLAALLGSLRAWFRVGGVCTRIRTETEEGLRLLPLPVGLCRLGDPGEIRTPDLGIRSSLLYPTELRGRLKHYTLLGCSLSSHHWASSASLIDLFSMFPSSIHQIRLRLLTQTRRNIKNRYCASRWIISISLDT